MQVYYLSTIRIPSLMCPASWTELLLGHPLRGLTAHTGQGSKWKWRILGWKERTLPPHSSYLYPGSLYPVCATSLEFLHPFERPASIIGTFLAFSGVVGELAQMVERSLSMREVPGSIPGFSKQIFFLFWPPIFFLCHILFFLRYEHVHITYLFRSPVKCKKNESHIFSTISATIITFALLGDLHATVSGHR